MNLLALAELLGIVFGSAFMVATGLVVCLILGIEVMKAMFGLFDKS